MLNKKSVNKHTGVCIENYGLGINEMTAESMLSLN